MKLTEKTFHFATNVREAFIDGDIYAKKDILMAIGQNPTIKDGILHIEINEWLVPIKDTYPKLEEDYLRLEPLQVPLNNERTEILDPVRLTWLPASPQNPNFFVTFIVGQKQSKKR